MTKEAKRGEKPSIENYYVNVSDEKETAGHDYKPTKEQREGEKTAKHLMEHPEIPDEHNKYLIEHPEIPHDHNKEGSDVLIIDWLKKMAMEARREKITRKPDDDPYKNVIVYKDQDSGRKVIGKTFTSADGDSIEFIVIDSETGEIVKQNNIRWMTELPVPFQMALENYMHYGNPGEKSN